MNAPTHQQLLAAALALLVLGCRDSEPLSPESSPGELGPTLAKVEGPAHIEGEIGPGANYEVDIPADWNGDLVLYAHGYRDPSTDVSEDPGAGAQLLRGGLLARGFGFGWTSYSENGFAVKDGAQRVHQLGGIFRSHFGKPNKTYVMGTSLGSLVALKLAERYPSQYAGALLRCGIIGGSKAASDYIGNLRTLFDYFFPGVLPGDAVNVPVGLSFNADVLPAALPAILSNLAAAMEMAGVDQLDLQWANVSELINGILTGLYFHTIATNDILERTHGHVSFDNMETAYSGSSDDVALNAGIDRFSATPDALKYLNHWYQPTGDLDIPVLTLHATRDPAAPMFHETAYAALVASAGNSNLLLQRSIDRFGHCGVTAAEALDAFVDLVDWVETGTKPGP